MGNHPAHVPGDPAPQGPTLCPGPPADQDTVRKSPQATLKNWVQVCREAEGGHTNTPEDPPSPREVPEARPSAKEMAHLPGQRQAPFQAPGSFQWDFTRDDESVMALEGHAYYFRIRVQGRASARLAHETVPILHLTYSARHSFPPGSLPTFLALPAFPEGRVLSSASPVRPLVSTSQALSAGPLETFLAIGG